MSHEKVTEVLDRYEQYLSNLTDANKPSRIEHLQAMIPKMREFNNDDRREKLMRWIGFMQGAFWSLGIYNLEELKQHNMPNE